MNPTKFIVTAVVAVAFAALTTEQAHADKGGTSVFHYKIHTAMSPNTDVDADAAGKIKLRLNQQGKSHQQRLQIAVSNLDADATYDLLALLGNDVDLTAIAEFDTDDDGAAKLKFTRIVTKKGDPKHPGGHQPLPGGLNPITGIRALEIQNGNDQTVLTADLTDPDKLQLLVKRAMTNDGVDDDAAASLRIKATQSHAKLRIRAKGLNPSADYSLAINGTSLQTFTSDAEGRLNITAFPAGSPDILSIHSLAILNADNISVLSTTLP